MKNILIAGGTGLIGSHLLYELKNQGYNVSMLSRGNHLKVASSVYEWDPARGELPLYALINQDAIINLAGTPIAGGRWTIKRKESILKSRIDSTRLLVRTINENRLVPKLFINASAIGFYGHRPGKKLTEKSEMGANFLSRVCSAWEEELLPLKESSIPCAVIRLGMVLSKSGGIFPTIIRPLKMRMNVCFGSGNQYFSWIHINDLIDCIGWLLNGRLRADIYNCVAPFPVQQFQFNDAVQILFDKKMLAIKVPARLLKIMLGELSVLLTDDQYVLPTRLLEQKFKFTYPSIDSALIDLLATGTR